MTAEMIIGLVLALLVMLVGVVGSFLPVIPGTPIILGAAVLHKVVFGSQGASVWVLVVMVILAGLTFVLDYIAGMIGAQKMGATWRGITGAVVGGLLGLFFSIPGIILGPFVGAVALEMAGGREFKPAAKAGLGAVLGLAVGAVGKVAIGVAMVILFASNVIIKAI
jgi:uncharacterized protein YqgC (DUF456 family)